MHVTSANMHYCILQHAFYYCKHDIAYCSMHVTSANMLLSIAANVTTTPIYSFFNTNALPHINIGTDVWDKSSIMTGVY
jgi:hypothetical protein